ncbi:MAG: hypothetical protein L0H15_10390 [Nitrosospira sp.]|nr:hypothetical protein [Nitrosospira sp.]
MGALLSTFHNRCPAIPLSALESTKDALVYLVQPADSSHSLDGSYFRLGVVTEDKLFVERADGAEDADRLYHSRGCSKPKHQRWMENAERMLSDPAIAGPLPSAGDICKQYRENSAQDCTCFARSFDMESSPSKRHHLLASLTALGGMQEALRDGNFAARAAYKCPRGSIPNFFRTALADASPSNADQPDDQQRLLEGTYRVQGKKGFREYSGVCIVTRLGNWQYRFTWDIGGKTRTGIGNYTGRTIAVEYGTPHPAVYSVLTNGSMRATLSDGFEQLSFSGEPPTGVEPGIRSQQDDVREAQCAQLALQLDRFGARPALRGAVEVLTNQYTQKCGSNPPPRVR